MFRQIWNRNHYSKCRGCQMSFFLIFLNPSFDHVRVRFLLQSQLFQWFELAFSLRERFVLWWPHAEQSNFAFSTAWDFIKIFEVSLERLSHAQITPGSWLSIWVFPWQSTPGFVQIYNSCLMPKGVDLFPYPFLLFILEGVIILTADMFITLFLSSAVWQMLKERKQAL